MLCKLWVRYAACDTQLAICNLRYANAGHVLNRIRFNGAAFIAILLYQRINIIVNPPIVNNLLTILFQQEKNSQTELIG